MMNFNPWAVLAAAASSFLLGGLWYSKALFGPAWGCASGMAATEKHGHPARVFGISFVFSLIAATVFAYRLGPSPDLWTCVKSGFLVGAGWVATCFGINYQFADRKPVMWLIDSGYHTAQFVLFGLVLGLWH